MAPRERFELPRGQAHAISSRAHYQAMRSRLAFGANLHQRLTLTPLKVATQEPQRGTVTEGHGRWRINPILGGN